MKTSIVRIGGKTCTRIMVLLAAIGISVAPAFADSWPNEKIYSEGMKYTVWIRTEQGYQGSGTFLGGEILHSQRVGLVATNYHVVDGAERIEVFFPFFSTKDNEWKSEREWYARNAETLSHRGYYTTGEVILDNPEIDIAIVEIDNFPGEPRGVKYETNTNVCGQLTQGESVHILGNPGDRKLWRWAAGHFVDCESDINGFLGSLSTEMSIAATGAGGHSGGPVFDGRGVFVGMSKSRGGETRVWAVTADVIMHGLTSILPMEFLVLNNEQEHDVPYHVEWRDEHIFKSLQVAELHKFRGMLSSGSRTAFAFSYSSDIRIEIGKGEDAVSYSLSTFANLGPAFFILKGVSPNRKWRVKEYSVKKGLSGLEMVDTGVNRYTAREMEDNMQFRRLRQGKVYNLDGDELSS